MYTCIYIISTLYRYILHPLVWDPPYVRPGRGSSKKGFGVAASGFETRHEVFRPLRSRQPRPRPRVTGCNICYDI